jgi:hypothetical protein
MALKDGTMKKRGRNKQMALEETVIFQGFQFICTMVYVSFRGILVLVLVANNCAH